MKQATGDRHLPRARPARLAARRQGVVLLMVLISVAGASMIALTFISSQGTSIGIANNVNSHVKARAVAESGLHMTISELQNNTSWRTTHSNGLWASNQSFGGGTFSVWGEDGVDTDGNGTVDGDSDLSDDTSDPVTLTVTATVDGVTHTVRAEGSQCSSSVGYPTEYGNGTKMVHDTQIAVKVTVMESVTVDSMSAYIDGPPPMGVRYAIYSDSAGEPDALLVESAQTPVVVNAGTWHWLELPISSTVLSPGDYWFALAFETLHMLYGYDSSGGEVRYKANDAVNKGYLANWGASDSSLTRYISIVAGEASGGGGGTQGSGNTGSGGGSSSMSVLWVDQP